MSPVFFLREFHFNYIFTVSLSPCLSSLQTETLLSIITNNLTSYEWRQLVIKERLKALSELNLTLTF